MSALKTGFAALVVVMGLSGSASAQQAYVGGYGVRGYGNSVGLGYYPGYVGNGYGYYGGYRGNYYSNYPNVSAPKVYNNMGGLMGAIRQLTGRPGSWKTTPNYGVSSNRRFR